MKPQWRPHTERPQSAPMSVLIAAYDDEGGYFLLSDLYTWDGTRFCAEETDLAPRLEKFWWIPESEVLEGLPYAQPYRP